MVRVLSDEALAEEIRRGVWRRPARFTWAQHRAADAGRLSQPNGWPGANALTRGARHGIMGPSRDGWTGGDSMSVMPVLERPVTEWDWRQRLIEIIMAVPEPPAKPKMTYEEFLAWADEDTLAEWVDGEVVMASPASDRHQDLVGFLESTLRPYVESHGAGIVRQRAISGQTGAGARAGFAVFSPGASGSAEAELRGWPTRSGGRDHFSRKRHPRPG